MERAPAITRNQTMADESKSMSAPKMEANPQIKMMKCK